MNKNSNYERSNTMAKKNIDWGSIGFSYIPTDKDMLPTLRTANGMADLPLIPTSLSMSVQVFFSTRSLALRALRRTRRKTAERYASAPTLTPQE